MAKKKPAEDSELEAASRREFVEEQIAKHSAPESAEDATSGFSTADEAPAVEHVDGPASSPGEDDRPAAIEMLRGAIAHSYGEPAAEFFIAARSAELATMRVGDIMEAIRTLPQPGSPEGEVLRGELAEQMAMAASTKPTVAGDLPSGVPDMLPPEELRSALEPPAPPVLDVPERLGEIRERTDAPRYYRVTRPQTLVIDGLLATFSYGQIIDDRNYDLAWLRQHGVEVVPSDPPAPYSSNL